MVGTAGNWTTRVESPADVATTGEVVLAAFGTPAEAGIVRALRTDPVAWVPGLAWLAQAVDGTVAGFALVTRCRIDDTPAFALGPCAVRPEYQRRGAGTAVIRAALTAARDTARAAARGSGRAENVVVVLGHPDYYPRFGFGPASGHGIRPTFDAPDAAMMALVFDPDGPVPPGTLHYPPAFSMWPGSLLFRVASGHGVIVFRVMVTIGNRAGPITTANLV